LKIEATLGRTLKSDRTRRTRGDGPRVGELKRRFFYTNLTPGSTRNRVPNTLFEEKEWTAKKESKPESRRKSTI